jgi:hypothetical protein
MAETLAPSDRAMVRSLQGPAADRPTNEKREVAGVKQNLEHLTKDEKRAKILALCDEIDANSAIVNALTNQIEAALTSITLIHSGETGADWDSAIADILDNDTKGDK